MSQRKKPKTWGDVFWRWVKNGCPREEAAFRADEGEKREQTTGRRACNIS